MPIGPGKYDEHVTRVMAETGAASALLIVIGGDKGFGFSHQMKYAGSEANADLASLELCIKLLREVADTMQTDARKLRQQRRGN
jgi:hypothetical protein